MYPDPIITPDTEKPGKYAIFSRRRPGQKRVMHAVKPDAGRTVCDLPIGAGSGLVRDGDYHGMPCPRCWS